MNQRIRNAAIKKNFFNFLRIKLYKIKKKLLNPRYYWFLLLRIFNNDVINNDSKKNVASMFLYSSAIFHWFKDNANELLFEHKLNKSSKVFDIGAYTGNWSIAINKKYNCNIYAFEPVKEYFNVLSQRTIDNKKVKVFNYGLGEYNKEVKIEHRGVQSSALKDSHYYDEVVQIKDIILIEQLLEDHIDLMHINIEGGEYSLLKRLIQTKLIDKILNLQIQFHEWYPSIKLSHVLRNQIHSDLKKTHKLSYSYDFVWEKWEKRGKNIFNNR